MAVVLVLRWLAAFCRVAPVVSSVHVWVVRLARKHLYPLAGPFEAVVSLRDSPGARMVCHQLGGEFHADVLSEVLFFTGVWEPAITERLRRILGEGDVFVDVGAHVGVHTVAASLLVGSAGRVVAVEPDPRALARLRRNVALRGPRGAAVDVIAAAAGARTGVVTLHAHRRDALFNTTVLGAGDGGAKAGMDVLQLVSSHIAPKKREDDEAFAGLREVATNSVWSPVRVPAVRLDETVGHLWPRVRAVKIDVEGAEWDVLQGLGELLQSGSGRDDVEVLVEVNPHWLQLQGRSAGALVRKMATFGFQAFRLAPTAYELEASMRAASKRTLAGQRARAPPAPFSAEDAAHLDRSGTAADLVFRRREGSVS